MVEEAIHSLHTIKLNMSLAHVANAVVASVAVGTLCSRETLVSPTLLSLAHLLLAGREDDVHHRLGSDLFGLGVSAQGCLVLNHGQEGRDGTARCSRQELSRYPAQLPEKSVLDQFYRQVLYFCACHSRSLGRGQRGLTAHQRLAIAALADVCHWWSPHYVWQSTTLAEPRC